MSEEPSQANPTLQLIGGGQMGEALAAGMLAAGTIEPSALAIVEVSTERRDVLGGLFPGVDVLDVPLPSIDTLLAVKPHYVLDVAAALDQPRRVLSIAAGITTSAIESVVPAGTPVIRAMPNTPALVGVGAAGLAAGSAAAEADLRWAVELLAAVGEAEVVTEAQLDAVTGLSGSGPAYYFLIAEAMIDAGVSAGLTRAAARTLAHQTMAGAAAMLGQSEKPASELRADVTTPNGTTAAGLRVLEQQGVRGAIIDAVAAATARSRELGQAD